MPRLCQSARLNNLNFCMHMKPTTNIKLLGALFLALAATASAGLKEIAPVAPEPAPMCEPFDWTGLYIGVNAGGDLGQYDIGSHFTDTSFSRSIEIDQLLGDNDTFQTYTAAFTFFNPREDAGRGSSFLGGGQIGFQKQWGRFVVGLEGDFDRAGSERSTSFTSSQQDRLENFEEFISGDPDIERERTVDANTSLTSSRKAQANWMASARLRAGYACGRCLFYVTGGGAFADVTATATDTATTTFSVVETRTIDFSPSRRETLAFTEGPFTETNVSKDSDTLVGWTAGGGVAWAATDCIDVGLEYRHSDFGSNTFHFRSHDSGIFPGRTSVDFQDDQATLRVNFRFAHFFGH